MEYTVLYYLVLYVLKEVFISTLAKIFLHDNRDKSRYEIRSNLFDIKCDFCKLYLQPNVSNILNKNKNILTTMLTGTSYNSIDQLGINR